MYGTAAQVPKIFSRILGPLANNPTLGSQHVVAPGYKNIASTLFTVREKKFKVTKPRSKTTTTKRRRRVFKLCLSTSDLCGCDFQLLIVLSLIS